MRMETLTSSGQALGRIGPTRWVVMIFGALPRELVQLRIVRNYRSRSEARLCRILEASPERAAPRCPLFTQCSGCQYQHLSYESQLYWKREHVKQALSRIAGIAADVAPTVPSPLQYHYRTKLTPHAQEPPPGRQRRARSGEDDIDYSAIGFLEQEWGSTRDASGRRWCKVVDVPSCPIATEALNQALPAERAKACAGGQPKGKLLLRDTVVDGVVTDPFGIVTERVPKFGAFHFRAGGFFQNNSSILPVFVEHVITAASAARVDGVSPRALVDIFCGVGLFALSAASRFQRVIGIEVDSTAVRLARRNAAEHGCEAEFLAADAAEGLAQVAAAVAPEDAVAILDPPRQGLTAEAREALASWRPRRVVYVSCDCATQARDLKDLVDTGYTIQSATPFDLFPQTRHLEVVVTLERDAEK